MTRPLRASGLALVLGGLTVGVPAAAAQAPTPAATGADVPFELADGQPRADLDLRATGEAPAGRRVVLMHRAEGAADWRTLDEARADEDGDFRLRADAPDAGRVRVIDPAAPATAPSEGTAVAPTAALRVRSTKTAVKRGARATVDGVALPRGAGRTVRLQERRGSRWRTIDRDRTDGTGRFALRHEVAHTGSRKLRVSGGGGAGVEPGHASAGRLVGLRAALASWYGPGLYGGKLACGGTLSAGTVGVAHKSLPCGSRITLRHGGRTVRTRVIDRGPYVGAREFDLTAATKARLGFGSTGTVLVDR